MAAYAFASLKQLEFGLTVTFACRWFLCHFSFIYLRPTSFGQKYGHLSYVNKWISFKKKFTCLVRLLQRQHILSVERTWPVLKIDFRIPVHKLICARLLHTYIENIVEILWPILFGSIFGSILWKQIVFPLFGAKLWVPIVNACLPRGQVPKIWRCIMKLCH